MARVSFYIISVVFWSYRRIRGPSFFFLPCDGGHRCNKDYWQSLQCLLLFIALLPSLSVLHRRNCILASRWLDRWTFIVSVPHIEILTPLAFTWASAHYIGLVWLFPIVSPCMRCGTHVAITRGSTIKYPMAVMEPRVQCICAYLKLHFCFFTHGICPGACNRLNSYPVNSCCASSSMGPAWWSLRYDALPTIIADVYETLKLWKHIVNSYNWLSDV